MKTGSTVPTFVGVLLFAEEFFEREPEEEDALGISELGGDCAGEIDGAGGWAQGLYFAYGPPSKISP